MTTQPESDGFAGRLADVLDLVGDDSRLPDDLDPDVDAVVTLLRAPSTWTGPPPDIKARLMAAVEAESHAHETPSGATHPTPLLPLLPLLPLRP